MARRILKVLKALAGDFGDAAHVRAVYIYLRQGSFGEASPDVFERDLLLRYFPKSQLESALARKVFVLPQSVEARS